MSASCREGFGAHKRRRSASSETKLLNGSPDLRPSKGGRGQVLPRTEALASLPTGDVVILEVLILPIKCFHFANILQSPIFGAPARILARNKKSDTTHLRKLREEQLKISSLLVLITASVACAAAAVRAETPGVTQTEIKIGNTVPYSGPVSSKGVTGRIIEEYFAMINEKGGVNGRKLKLVSLDDAFSPPKTVEAVRRLVEGDEVAFMFAMFGTAQNVATAKYLNARKVPQLFLVSSSVQWDDPKGKPWSLALPWAPPLYAEGGDRHSLCAQETPRGAFCSPLSE